MSKPMFVVATSNAGKLREFQAILGDAFVLRGLAEFDPVVFPDEGEDYEANAIAKARTAADALRLPAIADDSGLEVDGLGGAPGPLSARYGGPGLDDRGRLLHLLEALSGMRGSARRARFVCVAAWASPGGSVRVERGECEGCILTAPRGDSGFGYDPVFEVEGLGRAMAELLEEEKNRISHRGRALAALRASLTQPVETRS
ncbi:MAG: RdgB/HAM1 family non-canonical purine NTP pyrophosphatase [Myxococcales bacterium]|nr:RdgB/HAM1 family non-canonical purine NTP pyrophosphatase [Myxococcales bacterium]